jgi:hypothetical protein
MDLYFQINLEIDLAPKPVNQIDLSSSIFILLCVTVAPTPLCTLWPFTWGESGSGETLMGWSEHMYL